MRYFDKKNSCAKFEFIITLHNNAIPLRFLFKNLVKSILSSFTAKEHKLSEHNYKSIQQVQVLIITTDSCERKNNRICTI